MTSFLRIERLSSHFGLYLFFFCLVFLILEGFSYLFFRINNINPHRYNYIHIISGYQVFQNTPGVPYWSEVKEHPSAPPTIVDINGFASNNPITINKPKNTIRIFLMGGSAAVGTGQFQPFSVVHPYRLGTLSYSLGPAGQLEKYLQEQRPDLDFEVINAASVDRTLHQSMIYYLETISRFSPDIIINLDGYNDLMYGLTSGRPYADIESRLDHYINLLENTRKYRPYVMHLLNILYNKYLHRFVSDSQKQQFFMEDDLEQEQYSLTSYKSLEGEFINNSKRFSQILKHYMAILKSDNVDFIFALQPMLYRQINKQMSNIEDRMRRTVFSIGPSTMPEFRKRAILLNKFFFDQYLSGKSMAQVEQNGFGFLDMNQAIQHLKADFDLYIDYCHFTKPGSQAVAKILGDKVLQRLPQ